MLAGNEAFGIARPLLCSKQISTRILLWECKDCTNVIKCLEPFVLYSKNWTVFIIRTRGQKTNKSESKKAYLKDKVWKAIWSILLCHGMVKQLTMTSSPSKWVERQQISTLSAEDTSQRWKQAHSFSFPRHVCLIGKKGPSLWVFDFESGLFRKLLKYFYEQTSVGYVQVIFILSTILWNVSLWF